jgi:uncharacterized protein
VRVVFDTNIFIATLIAPGSNVAELYWLWREGTFTLLTSSAQLSELRRVSRNKKFEGIIQSKQAGVLINTLKAKAVFVEPEQIPDVSVDMDDNYILAIALEGRAEYLVSLDIKHVVKLKSVGRTRIVKPGEFKKALAPKHRRKAKNPTKQGVKNSL